LVPYADIEDTKEYRRKYYMEHRVEILSRAKKSKKIDMD
jgi:hypothetical protein